MALVIRDSQPAKTKRGLVIRAEPEPVNPLLPDIEPLQVDPDRAQAIPEEQLIRPGEKITPVVSVGPIRGPEEFLPKGLRVTTQTPAQIRVRIGGQIDKEFGEEAGTNFIVADMAGLKPPLWDEFLSKRVEDEAKSFGEKADELFTGAKRGGKNLGGALLRTLVRTTKTNAAGSISERLQLAKEVNLGALESLVRNTVGFVQFTKNLVGAAVDELPFVEEEARREYKRLLSNLALNAHITGGLVVDPGLVDPDLQLVSDIAISPEVLLGPLGVAARTGRAGRIIQQAARVPRVLGRGSVKAAALIPGGLAAVTEESLKALSRAKTKLAKKILPDKSIGAIPEPGLRQALKARAKAIAVRVGDLILPDELRNIKVPQSTKNTLGIALDASKLVPEAILFTAKVGKRSTQAMARKIRIISGSIVSPDRSKRLLDRLHQDHGIALAGVASRLGGTQAGDLLFNVVVEGTQASILSAAEASLAGQSLPGIGEAIGTTFAFAGPLGGLTAERGAGAQTGLLDPQGRLTSRARGSAEVARVQLENRQRELGVDIDQRTKFEALPDSVKAVLGQAAESGIIPRDVVMLSAADFESAAALMAGRDDLIASNIDDGAIFFPEDNVLMINANADLGGPAGLKIIGQELGSLAVREMIASQPHLVAREALRFEDSKGREMPVDRADSLGTIKINNELSTFIDTFNQKAEAVGARKINTFFEAIQEFYGAHAGVAMGENKSVFSPATPVWLQRVVHGLRGQLLRSTKNVINNTESAAKLMRQQATDATGRHLLNEFNIWRQEADNLKESANTAFDLSTTDVNLKERARLAEARAKRAGVELDAGKTAVEQAAIIVANDANSNGPVRTFTAQTKLKPKAGKGGMQRLLGDLVGVGEKVTGKTKIVGLPDAMMQLSVRRFGKADQEAAFDFLSDMNRKAAAKQAQNLFYFTRTGENIGKGDHRNVIPTGLWSVTNRKAKSFAITDKTGKKTGQILKLPEENGVLLMEVRDKDAIDHNLRLAEIDGLIDSFEQGHDQVMGELAAFQADPSTQLSDLALITLGDFLVPDKLDRATGERVLIPEREAIDLKTQRAKDFWNKNKSGKGKLEGTLKDIDFDRILAVADNIDGSTNFGQRGGQAGLSFTVRPDEPQQ